jgi:hypothetical protein
MGNGKINFVPQDYGRLFITNKRLIFIGRQRNINKAITIKSIITYNLYKESVLVGLLNKKSVLFEFGGSVDFEIQDVPDGLNEFIIVLNRVIKGSYTTDGHLLINKGYNPLFQEIATCIVRSGNLSTPNIQRTFLIGYMQLSEIIEQMQLLGMLSEDRKVLIKPDEINDILLNAPVVPEKELSDYDKAELNRNNPDSCIREPNENEVKVRTKGFFDKYASVTKDEMNIRKSFIESDLKGYNFFVISKEEYDRVNSKLKTIQT